MARKLFGVEKGVRLFGENADVGIDILFGTAAPGGDTGDQDNAPLGSLYVRKNGATSTLYQKIGTANSTADWLENGSSSAVIGNWRPERIRAVTNDAVSVGVRDLTASPFSDDDSPLLTAADFVVGDYIISDADGTPALLEVTAVSSPNVTFAAAATPLASNDTFVAINYLPDTPGDQEGRAIVNYNGSVMVKIGDIDWDFATGINLSGSYAAANGSISSADSVESAIEKLDGNQQDIQSASGLSQGDVNYGTFTGLSLADNQTSKQLFQRIETLLEQMRGVQVAAITTAATVDSVPHASVKACKWLVEAFEDATPANRIAVEIFALNDGTNVDDSVYSKQKLGSNFDLTLSVDISGADMRLRAASSTAGVTVTARRIEVVKSVL